MIEIFNNAMTWLAQHKTEILAVITSAEFITLITALISFIRNRKTTKDNTTSNTQLNSSVTELTVRNDSLVGSVSDLSATVASVSPTLTNIKKDIVVLKEEREILLTKLDTMLEVFSIVYSSIKDSQTRALVTAMLTNARHLELSESVKIKEELSQLKEAAAKAEKLKESAVTVADDVEHILKSIERC